MNTMSPQGSNSSSRFDQPLDVEGVQEFHAARILLLLRTCGAGKSGLLRGRTKLAKLDFFVRYPRFLEVGLSRLASTNQDVTLYRAGNEGVEASMIRYRFGPWDHRYYNLLAMLSARGLIRIGGAGGKVETYSLTTKGLSIADELLGQEAFAPVVERCRIVSKSFAHLNGTQLKEFIYEVFQDEVTSLAHGETIVAQATSTTD